MEADSGEGEFSPDLIGTTLFAAATIALLLALSLGSSLGWGSATILLLLACGVIGLGLVLPVERHIAKPLLSPDLIAQPVVWRAAVCVLLFAAALFGSLVQVPLLLQLSYGIGPSLSGLLLIPLTLAQVAVSTWAGMRVSVTGLPRGPLMWGLAVATVGFAALPAALTLGPIAIAAASILFGLGLRDYDARRADPRAMGWRKEQAGSYDRNAVLLAISRRRHGDSCYNGNPTGGDRALCSRIVVGCSSLDRWQRIDRRASTPCGDCSRSLSLGVRQHRAADLCRHAAGVHDTRRASFRS